ncbi:MAG: hypothetical protein MUC50_21040, partial [Myxococcota bacterium]|nr:hypothetical protein [Myxococcota bacterium]
MEKIVRREIEADGRSRSVCGHRPFRLVVSAVALSVLVCVPGWALDPQKKANQYVREVFDKRGGLPQDSISAIAQTPDGYIWIATQEGVARFDGVRFEVFNSDTSTAFTQNSIVDLLLDSRHRLWIGTGGGGVVLYEAGRFEAFLANDALLDKNVSSFWEDSTGSIWIGTNEGCTVIEKSGYHWNLTAEHGLPGNAVKDIGEDREGNIWIATTSGLARWSAGVVSAFTSENEPALLVNIIESVKGDTAGRVWIGTWGGGLVRYADQSFERVPSQDKKLMIPNILEDRDGNLWVALFDQGLGRVEGGRLVVHGEGNWMPGSRVNGLFEDREGNLLVGLIPGGLLVLRNGIFTTYETVDAPFTVYEDKTGDIWFGMTSKGLGRLRDGQIDIFGPESGFDVGARPILERPQGGLYVGTYNDGVKIFDGRRVTGELMYDGQPVGGNVRAILRASDGAIWYAVRRRGLYRLKDDTVEHFSPAEGLPIDQVFCLAEGPEATIWMGTWSSGLTRYRNGRFEVLEDSHALESDLILSLHVDPDGTVWAGTNGGGLVCYRDGRFTSIRKSDGLFDDTAYVLLEHQGHFWATSNNGVYRVSKQKLIDFVEGRVERVSSESFGEKDGLFSGECNGTTQPAGWKSHDGRLWFPTVAGLSVVDPEHLEPNTYVPRAFLTRFVVDEKPVAVAPGVRVGPGVDKLELHYTAPTLTNPQAVTFRYRLVGFDRDWVLAGPRRIAYYTNLDPGRYRFEVVPVNASGVKGREIEAFSFELVPAVWQTMWFRLCLILLALGLVWSTVALRIRTVKLRNIVLNKKVAQRTAELATAHAKIVKLEKESLEKQMAGGFAHEIRNALFGAKLLMTQLLKTRSGPESESIHKENAKRLADLFVMLRSKLDEDVTVDVAKAFKKLNDNGKLVEQAFVQTLASVD